MTAATSAARYVARLRQVFARHHGPCFPVDPARVSCLADARDFHNTLKANIAGAERRIVLATMYIGNGALERELLQALEARLNHHVHASADAGAAKQAVATCDDNGSSAGFRVHILVDQTRGSRMVTGKDGVRASCLQMLQPLLDKFPDHVEISLYQSPDMYGAIERRLPSPINEAIGLTHAKVYLVDDRLVMTGANLSETYFTTCQDRYMQFVDAPLADFFARFVKVSESRAAPRTVRMLLLFQPAGSCSSRMSTMPDACLRRPKPQGTTAFCRPRTLMCARCCSVLASTAQQLSAAHAP